MGTFAEELANFKTAYADIQTESMKTGSVFDLALAKIDEQFTAMGISGSEKAKLIASVAGQIATSISTASQQTALGLLHVPSDIDGKASQKALTDSQKLAEDARKLLIDAQKSGENAKASMTSRQTTAFADKLKVEVMKAMGGIAQMEATNTGTTTDTMTTLLTKIANVEAAAT